MIHLERLPKPQILIEKEAEWTETFIASEKYRPDGKKYGHQEIRTQLHAISFKKCFYSEVKFATENEGQIDHYIEVEEDKTKAFDWDNLYLSHKDSNQGKPNNKTIPNDTTLNPFQHTDEEIEEHLDFEDECIRGKTQIGLKTIQKYRLDKQTYDILRSKELRKFEKCFISLLQEANNQQRNLVNDEIEILNFFAQPDRPFSLMFRLLLKKNKLI